MMENNRPKSHTGDYSIKRRFGKGFRNSKKSMLICPSYKKEEDTGCEDNYSLTPYRSCSLNALHTGQVLIQPRMAQLETLEAKMARIENSLSATPRKKKISSSNNSVSSPFMVRSNTCINMTTHHQGADQSQISSYNKKPSATSTLPKLSTGINGTLIYRTSKDIVREMEALKTALKDKENVIDNLKGQLNSSIKVDRLSTSYLQSKQKNDNGYADKQTAEERIESLKQEVDKKSLLIKKIKLELDRVDITDNIDIHIQQAELEYQLGREELNLLSLMEEIQNLQTVVEDHEANEKISENNIFKFVHKKHSSVITLYATEIIYDPKSPRFGASYHERKNGLIVDWSTEDSGLVKGDLIMEINGKLSLCTRTGDDMIRLLSISPSPARIVVMREHSKNDIAVSNLREELAAYREKAGEAERIRDSFRSDNVRLTHRISYLEEQVTELLNRVSKPEQSTPARSSEEALNNSQVQIFQKGPKVTVLGNSVAPSSKPRSYSKTRDSTATVSQKIKNRTPNKSVNGPHRKDETVRLSESMSSLPVNNWETPDSVREINKDVMQKKSLHYLSSPNQYRNIDSDYLTVNERRLRYMREAQNSFFNSSSFNPDRHNRHFQDDRSCKSADFDSEPNYHSSKHATSNRTAMYDSETSSDYSRTLKYPRPIPPQKPLRLSLHKECSLQSVKIINKSNSEKVKIRNPCSIAKDNFKAENVDDKTN